MKLYITGPVGSGKSTLARHLSEKTGIPRFELDQVVHEPDPDYPGNNRKRTVEARDRRFAEILLLPSFIMEDAGRACFSDGMEAADQVVLLDFAAGVRRRRIFLRWLKQNLGLESCRYRPDLNMLKSMFGWSRNYDSGADNLRERLRPFSGKLTVLHSPREAKLWLKHFS